MKSLKRLARNGQQGFTIIEVTLVLALISALFSLVLAGTRKVDDALQQHRSLTPPNVGVGNSSFSSDAKLLIEKLRDPNDPSSTQSLTWAIVTGVTDGDPAGTLDPSALHALYDNLTQREADLRGLIAQGDDLLKSRPDTPDRQTILDIRSGLAQSLDGVLKMKALVRSRATAGSPSAP